MAPFLSARRLAPLVLTPLLTLVITGSAHAVVGVDSGGSLITASPGSFTVAGDGAGSYVFTAPGIIAGNGCTLVVSGTAKCPADGITSMLAAGSTLGDDTIVADVDVAPKMIALGHGGNDTLTTGPADDSLSGGSGNDTLNGSTGDDSLTDVEGFTGSGGGGNDALRGGNNDDFLDAGILGAGVGGATSGGGHDLLDGGQGTDTVDYGQRTAPVTVTVDTPGQLGTTGNDGEAGEQDNVINTEHLIGGSAGDTLTASNIPSLLEGRRGNDTLIGGDAGNTLDGGFGSDTVNGGAAGDTVLAQDGEVDTITCGGGNDVVQADGFDTVAADCETVTRTAAITPPGQTNTVTVEVPTALPPQAGPVIALPKSLKADARGRVKVTVGCPKATKAGCLFGTLTLATAPKTGKARKVASGTFTLRPGKTAKVALTLSAAARKSLKKSKKLAVTLTATALNGDVQGRTTTTKLTVKR